MKKIFVLTLWLSMHMPIQACDVCGCGIRDASFNMGFAQSIQSHIILSGFQQYRYITEAQQNGAHYVTTDKITRIPLQYVHQVNPKWQVQLNTDMHILQRNNAFNEAQKEHLVNPSDIQIAANYRLIDNRKNIFTPHHMLLFIGANGKLPTGDYQSRDSEKRLLPMQLQAGNGSYAIGFQTVFSYRYRTWGFNTMTQAMYNTTNELSYQQGAQYQASAGINKVISSSFKWIFIPQIAYNAQHYQNDEQYNQNVAYSGGSIQSIQLQLEAIYKSIYLLAQYQIPQRLDIPIGAPKMQNSFQIRLGYLISRPEERIENMQQK